MQETLDATTKEMQERAKQAEAEQKEMRKNYERQVGGLHGGAAREDPERDDRDGEEGSGRKGRRTLWVGREGIGLGLAFQGWKSGVIVGKVLKRTGVQMSLLF